MANKKRVKHWRKHSPVMASPGTTRRRRNYGHAKTRKAKRRKKGFLHDGLPLVGKIGLSNPLIGGAAGGGIAMVLKKFLPESLIPVSMAPYKNYIKGGILVAGAFLAKKMKQEMIAAGLTGAAVALTMKELGIMADETPFKKGNFANPNLLNDNNGINMLYDENSGSWYSVSNAEMKAMQDANLLSDEMLLSEDIYPNYMGR